MMPNNESEPHDLDNLRYKEWVRFIFDHPIVSGKRDKEWYFEEAWEFAYKNAELQAEYVTRLFEKPRFLLKSFTKNQIEQGMWFLFCSQDFLGSLLKNKSLRFSSKKSLIWSIESLYRKLFRIKEVGLCVNMFWDGLTDSCFDYPIPAMPLSASDKKIQNEMFLVLGKILGIKKDYIQTAALHGLGHLQHPKTKWLIEKYLKEHSNLSEVKVKYARECIAGKMM
jgi:hypothetical protein